MKRLVAKNYSDWLTSLGKYVLNKIDFKELIEFDAPDSIRQKRLCQAHFQKAIKAFVEMNFSGFNDELITCENYIPQAFFLYEYHLSRLIGLERISRKGE